jgi:glucose dehydrogenase
MRNFLTPVVLGMALGLASSAGAQSWPVYGGDSGNTRFSESKQINTGNVNKLKVQWALQLGTNRSQESTPILSLRRSAPKTPLRWMPEPAR